MKLSKCTREQFVASISNEKSDRFARTFVSKADMQQQWEYFYGAFEGEALLAAIITTVSKRTPYVANLQLLHTFSKYRGMGAARELCMHSLLVAKQSNARYFRVSSEVDAVGFYEKIGFKFWGEQKSGCQLSIFRIGGDTFESGCYDYSDTTIYNAIHRKGKGGCVRIFDITNIQKTINLEGF